MLCYLRVFVFFAAFFVSSRVLCSQNVTVDDDRQLAPRGGSVKFSFYDVGLGACGEMNKASDFIVALNSAQFTSGDWCFKTITIHYGGKSAQAKVMDMCPGCPYRGLDLSRGLFDYFASQSAGIIYGDWISNEPESQKKPSTNKHKSKKPKPRLQPSAPELSATPTVDTEESGQEVSDMMATLSAKIPSVTELEQEPSSAIVDLRGRMESVYNELGRLELSAARAFRESVARLE